MHRRLAVLAPVLLAGCLLGPVPDAGAAWARTSATSTTRAAATSMPSVPAAPVVSGSGLAAARTFTVTWTTATLSPGRPVTGYLVTRLSAVDTLITGGSCKGVTTADGVAGVYVPSVPGNPTQSCTDVNLVGVGTVRYSVVPVYGRWLGAVPSPASAATT